MIEHTNKNCYLLSCLLVKQMSELERFNKLVNQQCDLMSNNLEEFQAGYSKGLRVCNTCEIKSLLKFQN